MGKKVFCGVKNCIFQICGSCNVAVLKLAEDPGQPNSPGGIQCQSFKSVDELKDDL